MHPGSINDPVNKEITEILILIKIHYEFEYRFLFTDYLDDVSKSYINLDVLAQAKGPKAVEMAYRKDVPFIEEGLPKGGP